MPQTNHNHHYPDDATKAKHLAFLLAQSVMPQEQKEAWVNLLPLMTSEQVDTLIEILEKEHHGYAVASERFLTDLKKLETNLRAQINKLKLTEQTAVESFIQQRLAQTKTN